MERLKKFMTALFLNTGTEETPVWARIGKSTVFALALNAKTETNDFIEDEMPTDEVMYYKPSLPQELQTNKGDPAFDSIYEMFKNLPTGEAVKKQVLIAFAGADPCDAWLTNSTLILKELNTVAEKITFDININKVSKGTATVTDGVPAFTAAS